MMYKCSLTIFSSTNLSLKKSHDGGVGMYADLTSLNHPGTYLHMGGRSLILT